MIVDFFLFSTAPNRFWALTQEAGCDSKSSAVDRLAIYESANDVQLSVSF